MGSNARKIDKTTTGGPRPHTKSIRLHFSTTPEDQILYAALKASADYMHRHPLGWQARHLLGVILGQRATNGELLPDTEDLAARVRAGYMPLFVRGIRAIDATGWPIIGGVGAEAATSGPPKLRLMPKENEQEE